MNGNPFVNEDLPPPRHALDLTGRVAVVTGSGRNIGRGVALELAAQGASVVVNTASNRAAAQAVVAEIESREGEAVCVVGDVSQPEIVEQIRDVALTRFGRIDVCISNANERLYKNFFETTPEDWHRHLNMQLTASFLLAKAVVPSMITQGWGRLIHVNGPDGWTGGRYRLPASSGKAGLRNLTKSLAGELGQYGITVNDVVPGPVDTIRDVSTHPQVDARFVQARIAEMPLGRLVSIEEIAWACLWLCSARSSAVTGTALHVDGGWRMLG